MEIPALDIVLPILIGGALLFFGRRLFWLCLAVLGFYVAFALTAYFVPDPSTATLILALGLGVLGALLAVFLQKVAVAVAGFLLGAYGAVFLVEFYGMVLGGLEWLLALVAGVAGSIIAGRLFEIAIVVLSSLVGAALISGASGLLPGAAEILFLALAVVGIATQISTRGKKKGRKSD